MVREEEPSRRAEWLLRVAAVLIISGICLILLGPPKLFGLDAGQVGGTLLPLGVLLALVAFGTTRPQPGSVISFGEKKAMLSLGITLIAGAYLFSALWQLGWNVEYPNRALRGVASNVVAIVIVGAILGRVMRKRERASTLIDERDVEVGRRAAQLAHWVLVLLLAIYVVSLGFPPARWMPVSSQAGIAHGIILLLMLSELVRHSTATWIYRRDRS